jgi:hypothetical protein
LCRWHLVLSAASTGYLFKTMALVFIGRLLVC